MVEKSGKVPIGFLVKPQRPASSNEEASSGGLVEMFTSGAKLTNELVTDNKIKSDALSDNGGSQASETEVPLTSVEKEYKTAIRVAILNGRFLIPRLQADSGAQQ